MPDTETVDHYDRERQDSSQAIAVNALRKAISWELTADEARRNAAQYANAELGALGRRDAYFQVIRSMGFEPRELDADLKTGEDLASLNDLEAFEGAFATAARIDQEAELGPPLLDPEAPHGSTEAGE